MGDRPNFLVFCTDQMQSASLSCHGNPDVRTPNIDRLAADGVSFRRAYCSNPVCMPSRSTTLTGLTPRGHGCISNGTVLPASVPTVPGALAQAGYRTHAVGKLHFQPFSAAAPQEGQEHDPPSWESREFWNSGRCAGLPLPYYGYQGVDYVGGHVHYCFGDYARWVDGRDPDARALYGREKASFAGDDIPSCWRLSLPKELHYNEWIARRSIEFIRDASGPFFLWCSFPDPHFPFAACAPYSEMYDPASLTLSPTRDLREDLTPHLARTRERRHPMPEFDERALREITAQTYGMITHVDDCIGQVLECLEQEGLYDNTTIVMMADHGEYLGSHHLLYKGSWPWEEVLRVPFVWKGISGEPHGAAGAQVVSMLDFAPTILDYAGVGQECMDTRGARKADPVGLPGRSLRLAVEGGDTVTPRPALVEHDEDWLGGAMNRSRVLVGDRFKIAVFAPSGDGLLVDMEDDPLETRNLWDSPDHAATRERMLRELVRQLAWTDRLDLPRICGA